VKDIRLGLKHPEVRKFISGERSMEELGDWLNESSDAVCDGCGEKLNQGESLTGTCDGCLGAIVACDCVFDDPARYRGEGSRHFRLEPGGSWVVIAHCPSYWRRKGYTVEREKGLETIREMTPEEKRMEGLL
jgi:hypothetical protein